MMIQEVETNKIQLDKTQPRKFIDHKKVKEMAKSIIRQGVINPIEIDKNYVIVTGELRYRASREAGLKTIPCKIINISKDKRFERQVIENIHHNTMSDMDTANALKKLVNCYQVTPVDKGISFLANSTGKSREWINEKLYLLKTGKKFQNKVKKGEISGTMVRAIRHLPDELKGKMEEKIIKGEIKNRDVAVKLSQVLKENPKKADALLDLDLTVTAEESLKRISNVAQTEQEQQWGENNYFEEVEKSARKLTKLLRENPFGKSEHSLLLNEFSKQVVKATLMPLPAMIASFVKGYDVQAKITTQIIEGETE